MSDYVHRDRSNFYNLMWLDQFMMGHEGFIAGGCFKDIFNQNKVKDIDIFFKDRLSFEKAVQYYNENEDYIRRYSNKKVVAFKHKKSEVTLELIKSIFGEPEEILNRFDFTVVKFAYYKDKEKTYSPEDIEIWGETTEEEIVTYKVVHHKDFFEHLHFKRLVIKEDIPFPIGTFERVLKYSKYGYFPCRESKVNLIKAIKNSNNDADNLSKSLYDGHD